MAQAPIDRSCGPEGCEIDWLVSSRVEVDADRAQSSILERRAVETDREEGVELCVGVEGVECRVGLPMALACQRAAWLVIGLGEARTGPTSEPNGAGTWKPAGMTMGSPSSPKSA